jgi:hypothetical protein
MTLTDIIDTIEKITDKTELVLIADTTNDRIRWLNKEVVEEFRQKLMYDATIDYPIGARVKIKSYYRTMEGREGTITSLIYPVRGSLYVAAHVQLAKGKGVSALQCLENRKGDPDHARCVRVNVASARVASLPRDPTTGKIATEYEILSDVEVI